MIRDFVAGVVWGGVVAGVGLGVVSQVAPMAQEQTLPAVVVAENLPQPVVDEKPAETVTPKPAVDEAKPEITAPTVKAKPAVEAPAVPVEAEPKPEPTAEAPADPAPMAPVTEAAQPAAPATEAQPAAPVAEGQGPVVISPATAPEGVTPEAPPLAEGAPEQPAPEQPAPEQPTAEATPPAPAQSEAAPQPVADPAPTLPAAPKATPDEVLLQPQPEPAAPAALAPAPVAPAAVPEPGLGGNTVEGVTTGRLPKIGDPAPDAAGAAPVNPADQTPLQRYARSFENPEAKPLYAILLVDDGSADLDRAQLAALPFPVTFVIDPLAPNAAAAMATYRAAGQEVAMFGAGIPEGATAADVEQTFQTLAATLPETVAVIDPGAAGFQNDRKISAAVVPILKAQGRGLITFDQGLNAADQVARRENLPAALIFRTLDDEGEDTPLIRRYLDRAAFKAAQEGRVVVMGSTKPETIAALLEWKVEGRASSVALAPASALLTAP